MDSCSASLVNRLAGLRAASIDASSVIYLLKAGFLGYLAAEVQLSTIPEVVEETGWRGLPVRQVAFEAEHHGSTDDTLLAFSVTHELPLISEDRKLLQRAGLAGLPYYNALMMLDLLVIRGRFDDEQYQLYRERLVEVGRYHPDVLATEAAVIAAARRSTSTGRANTPTDPGAE